MFSAEEQLRNVCQAGVAAAARRKMSLCHLWVKGETEGLWGVVDKNGFNQEEQYRKSIPVMRRGTEPHLSTVKVLRFLSSRWQQS